MASPPDLLARVPLFQELGPDDLKRVAEVTRLRSFADGDYIFEIGEAGRSLYILTTGSVQILHPNQPSILQLARIGPGDFIGEMALLNDSPRSATARAVGGVEALVLDKVDFRALVLEQPEVALKLLEVMSKRIRKADEQISGLSSQAVRDPLTGLLNRLAFNERLEEEAARSRRYGGSFSLILVDLSDLTSVNETLGHQVGDEILAWVGRLLNEHTRASDVPFRFEQDIFSVLCPWTSADVADLVATRLATLVGEARPPVDAEVSLSLVAASSTCPDHGREGQALFHHAERALLAAKAKVG
jgi:CRP/FNR family transcriptional regulator, cyclic AMP receptor protein